MYTDIYVHINGNETKNDYQIMSACRYLPHCCPRAKCWLLHIQEPSSHIAWGSKHWSFVTSHPEYRLNAGAKVQIVKYWDCILFPTCMLPTCSLHAPYMHAILCNYYINYIYHMLTASSCLIIKVVSAYTYATFTNATCLYT